MEEYTKQLEQDAEELKQIRDSIDVQTEYDADEYAYRDYKYLKALKRFEDFIYLGKTITHSL